MKPQIAKLLAKQKPKQIWITGDSLVGALAVVCAYDLIEYEHLPVQGLMTFGQPMIAGQKLSDYLNKALLGKYAHFVNEADIAPRVPPSLKPCGSLVWFTKGTIKRSKSKRVLFGANDQIVQPPGGDDELPPLTEREFQDAKEAMRKKTQAKPTPDEPTVMEALPPSFNDHVMEFYLEKIRKLSKGDGGTNAGFLKDGP